MHNSTQLLKKVKKNVKWIIWYSSTIGLYIKSLNELFQMILYEFNSMKFSFLCRFDQVIRSGRHKGCKFRPFGSIETVVWLSGGSYIFQPDICKKKKSLNIPPQATLKAQIKWTGTNIVDCTHTHTHTHTPTHTHSHPSPTHIIHPHTHTHPPTCRTSSFFPHLGCCWTRTRTSLPY